MCMNRRSFLRASSSALALPSFAQGADEPFRVHQWVRDPRNPVFRINGGWFDETCCMNPHVITHEGRYWLFYGGGDAKNLRRVCLATCPVEDVTQWERHGPLFDLGGKGAFDERWCVLPCVHRIGGKWHLYYTGRAMKGEGLQAFGGIGLLTSMDLKNWTRHSAGPVLLGDGFPQWPSNKGVAGAGRILELPQADGRVLYRMHYTIANGTPSKDLLVHQEKHSVIAHSYDGITWTDRRVVLSPRRDVAYENAATVALNVWPVAGGWRAIYAAIGTQFGAYSICEATSADGLVWQRGAPGENLSLPPGKAKWENQMTSYPNVIREGGKLRLFYCGNGYGKTGIGTALAEPVG